MTEESRYLQGLARRVAQAYTQHPRARAALLSGSAALGESDRGSDVDLMVYYDAELPSQAELDEARLQNHGGERLWQAGSWDDGGLVEAYPVAGVEIQIVHITVAAWEGDITTVQQGLDTGSALHKAMSGTLDGLALHGAALIARWKTRIAAYPEALARAVVQAHLKFFPLWGLRARLESRDALLWGWQSLLEATQNLLGVLAGLNRLYYSTFQFKRTAAFVNKMRLAPPDLARRLDEMFRLGPFQGAELLETLLAETLALVDQHLPGLDTSVARSRLGWRPQPWQMQPLQTDPEQREEDLS